MDSKLPLDPVLSMDHSPAPARISQLLKRLAIIQLPHCQGCMLFLSGPSISLLPSFKAKHRQVAVGVGTEDS